MYNPAGSGTSAPDQSGNNAPNLSSSSSQPQGGPGGGGLQQQTQGPGGGGQQLTAQQQQQQLMLLQQQQQAKELNPAMLCRLGQETVQEIVTRTQDLFQTLKTMQPPDGKQGAAMLSQDKKTKFPELLKNIKAHFKRLRLVYEKIEENFPTDKVIHHEAEILQKSETDMIIMDESRNTEAYKMAVEEYREALEQVLARNRHLKETIDHLRQIVWDVNTMLSMRKD